MMRPPTLSLVCDTNPMCYGSSTALLCILDPLREELGGDVHVTAMVHGVTREVLSEDRSVDAALEVDVKSPSDVERALSNRAIDAALVVSNQSSIEVYRRLGIPLFFVDILYWFGLAKTGPVWRMAEQTFAQNFPGVQERARQADPPPTVVGPLLRDLPPAAARRRGTLVALGGGRSRWVLPGVNSHYATSVADWVVRLSSLPEPITLAAGREALASIPREHPIRRRADLVTLPHLDYLARLASSELLLTAPGLNAVFEGLYSATPTATLPPQNASQVAQLQRYEQAGIFPSGLNLPALDAELPESWAAESEAVQTQLVLESLRRIARPARRDLIVDTLARQIATLPTREHLVREFCRSLGPPGGHEVARALASWWRMRWM